MTSSLQDARSLTPSSSVAARSAPGAPGSSAGPVCGASSCVETGTLGSGASSRAAGMVRAQGGTETAVRLGMFSRDFYAGQHDLLGVDSGFVAQGYFMPCFSPRRWRRRTIGSPCSRALGLDVRWVDPDEVDALNPALAPGQTLGGVLRPRRRLHRPAAQRARLHRCTVRGGGRRCWSVRRSRAADLPAGPSRGSTTSAGTIDDRAGRPDRRADAGGRRSGRRRAHPGRRRAAPGGRRQPHPDLRPDRLPMVFDLASGIYWRPQEGGLLWG